MKIDKLRDDKNKGVIEKTGGIVGFCIGSFPALAVGGVAIAANMLNGDSFKEASDKAEKPMEAVADLFTEVGEAIAKPVLGAVAGTVVKNKLDKTTKKS